MSIQGESFTPSSGSRDSSSSEENNVKDFSTGDSFDSSSFEIENRNEPGGNLTLPQTQVLDQEDF